MATWIGAMNHAVLCWTLSDAASRLKFLFSNECAIYRIARGRNLAFWSKENPYFTQEVEHNAPHVVIWAGMT
jgi:hypothetical protein